MCIFLQKPCPLNKHNIVSRIHNRKSNYLNLQAQWKLPLREADKMKQFIVDPFKGKQPALYGTNQVLMQVLNCSIDQGILKVRWLACPMRRLEQILETQLSHTSKRLRLSCIYFESTVSPPRAQMPVQEEFPMKSCLMEKKCTFGLWMVPRDTLGTSESG